MLAHCLFVLACWMRGNLQGDVDKTHLRISP